MRYEILFKNGQKYTAEKYKLHKKAGVDWIYFETHSNKDLTVDDAECCDSWPLDDIACRAWEAPLSTTVYCRRIR